MEISPDGGGLCARSRFAKFTNLPELQQISRAFSDVQSADMLNLPRPRLKSGKPIVIACPMSDEQSQLQQELVERYEMLGSEKIDPRIDNALSITTDGRKFATDARMLGADAPDFPESKVNRLVENVPLNLERDDANTRHATHLRRHGVNPTLRFRRPMLKRSWLRFPPVIQLANLRIQYRVTFIPLKVYALDAAKRE